MMGGIMVDKNVRVLKDALKAQNRQPPKKRHNGLDSLLLPPSERPSFLESVNLQIYYYLTPRIVRVANDNKKGGLYVPPGMANEILFVDGIPGVRVLLRPRVETPKEVLALLYQGYKARRLL